MQSLNFDITKQHQITQPSNIGSALSYVVGVHNTSSMPIWFTADARLQVIAACESRAFWIRANRAAYLVGDTGARCIVEFVLNGESFDHAPVEIASKVQRLATPYSGSAAARRLLLQPGIVEIEIDGYPRSSTEAGVVFFAFGDNTIDCTGYANAQGFVPAQSEGKAQHAVKTQYTLTFSGDAPTEGDEFVCTIGGIVESYTALDTDTTLQILAESVLQSLAALPYTITRNDAVLTIEALTPRDTFTVACAPSGATVCTVVQIAPCVSLRAGADFVVLLGELRQ
jgi:hypothetical protein